MSSVVLGVGHHDVGRRGGDPVGEIDGQHRRRAEQAGRQTKVAVIREHHRFVLQPAADGDAGGVELRQVQAEDVECPHFARRLAPDGRHDHALADSERHWNADHVDPGDRLAPRKIGSVLGSENGDLMSGPRPGMGQPLHVDRQAGNVRPVVRQGGQDAHRGSANRP